MMALRMTRPDTDRRCQTRGTRRVGSLRGLAMWLGVVLVGMTGCSGESQDGGLGGVPSPDPYRPSMTQLPAPAPDRIVYKGGTLTMYDLPAGRWMVQRPGAPYPYPIGPKHTLPEGLDAENIFVYYCRPGGQQSGHVSLAQIQAAGREHDSQIR
ncbi:MAG: hypothetical protein JWO38_2372 [Gemmataceae bacterium]|nr:hypothetical protein [Gemmataceae bacterium]